MRVPSSAELLGVWEEGCNYLPTKRALLLLGAAFSEPPEQIAQLSIGRRDRKLLQLRERLFGSRLIALARCPDCGEALEAELQVADLIAETPADDLEPLRALHDGCEMRFRLPNSLDLLQLTAELPPEEAHKHVIGRCLIEARRGGQPVPGETLTPDELEAMARQMAEADPQGNMELTLECPACSRKWAETFDIVAFLWSEMQCWAGRLLLEIHELASAYGWNETEILSLNPRRRQTYLDLVRQ